MDFAAKISKPDNLQKPAITDFEALPLPIFNSTLRVLDPFLAL